MMSKLVKIRRGMLKCLEFQNQCTPFIVFKVKGLFQKQSGEAFTEDTNRTLGAPCKSLPKAAIKTFRPPLTPKPVSKGPWVSPQLRSGLLSLVHPFPSFHVSTLTPEDSRLHPGYSSLTQDPTLPLTVSCASLFCT